MAESTGRWRRMFDPRPWWMNLVWAFCLYMTFFYLPFDLLVKPVERDVEVWFGIAVHGWAAKLTEPLHWAIYAAGSYGFWRMRDWMWPWAALYVAQVALGMLVWSLRDPHGPGWLGGGALAVPFAVLAVALWRARPRFGAPQPV
jgi:hypothetical protein